MSVLNTVTGRSIAIDGATYKKLIGEGYHKRGDKLYPPAQKKISPTPKKTSPQKSTNKIVWRLTWSADQDEAEGISNEVFYWNREQAINDGMTSLMRELEKDGWSEVFDSVKIETSIRKNLEERGDGEVDEWTGRSYTYIKVEPIIII